MEATEKVLCFLHKIVEMRIRISLRGKGWIPFNYNLNIAYLIYNRIDTELAAKLHSTPGYKYFTFSLLQIPRKKVSQGGIYIRGDAFFFFSSPLSDIITSLVSGVLEDPEMKIGGATLFVEEIEVLAEPKLSGKVAFSTLSPVVVRIIRQKNNTLKTLDLSPSDEEFNECLKNNLKKKYEDLYGKIEGDISFSEVHLLKSMRIQIKDTYHRGSMMTFEVEGDRNLIKLGYEVGFGEKNGLGFGMGKIIKQ